MLIKMHRAGEVGAADNGVIEGHVTDGSVVLADASRRLTESDND